MISLVIADERALVREGIRRILSDCDDIRVVAVTASGPQFHDVLEGLPADVVLLGTRAAGHDAAGIISRLSGEGGRRVLALASEAGPRLVSAALRAGAAGVCTLNLAPSELMAAIRVVASGGRYVMPGLEQAVPSSQPEVSDLSRRELEVLRLIGSGWTSRQIAEHLGLSPKTISTYRGRIMDKLNLRSTAAIVRFVLERGLAD